MQGSVGAFNSWWAVCEGLNQGLPAKAAGGVGDATITWPRAPVPRADLSQLWACVRKQSVVRGIGFCASCVCFLLPRLGMVTALHCQIQVLDLTGSLYYIICVYIVRCATWEKKR